MSSKERTTVVLNDEAQKIKDRLVPGYSPTALFSAGVILFNKLTALEQRELLSEVMSRRKAKDLISKLQTAWESVSEEDRVEFCLQKNIALQNPPDNEEAVRKRVHEAVEFITNHQHLVTPDDQLGLDGLKISLGADSIHADAALNQIYNILEKLGIDLKFRGEIGGLIEDKLKDCDKGQNNPDQKTSAGPA